MVAVRKPELEWMCTIPRVATFRRCCCCYCKCCWYCKHQQFAMQKPELLLVFCNAWSGVVVAVCYLRCAVVCNHGGNGCLRCGSHCYGTYSYVDDLFMCSLLLYLTIWLTPPVPIRRIPADTVAMGVFGVELESSLLSSLLIASHCCLDGGELFWLMVDCWLFYDWRMIVLWLKNDWLNGRVVER